MIIFSSFPRSKFTWYQNEIILEQYPNYEKFNPKKVKFLCQSCMLVRIMFYSILISMVRISSFHELFKIASWDIKHLKFLTTAHFNKDSIILVCFWSSSSSYFVCLRYPPPIFMKPLSYYHISSRFCKLVSRFPYTQP